jgi:prepilin-type N-terminal cleavage/methylation domain-containing protein
MRRSSKTDGKSVQKGFSLVELITVVAIVFVLSSFAIIQTATSTANARANAAAGALTGQLRQARELAISMRRNILVQVTAPNQIQLTVQTLPGEATAKTIPAVLLNDGAPGGCTFTLFSGLPDTPMGFGNSSAINYAPASGGTAGLSVMFSSSGSLVGTTASSGFATVGNNNPINATFFIGLPGKVNSARAVTVLGATGRVRSYYWTGPASGGASTSWQE